MKEFPPLAAGLKGNRMIYLFIYFILFWMPKTIVVLECRTCHKFLTWLKLWNNRDCLLLSAVSFLFVAMVFNSYKYREWTAASKFKLYNAIMLRFEGFWRWVTLSDVEWRWVALGGVEWRWVALSGVEWRWVALSGLGKYSNVSRVVTQFIFTWTNFITHVSKLVG